MSTLLTDKPGSPRISPSWAFAHLHLADDLARDAMKRDLGEWFALWIADATSESLEEWQRQRDLELVMEAAPRFWFPGKLSQ